MPIMRTYQCPDCEVRFEVLHMRRDDPFPDECPKCGSTFEERPEPELPAVHIGGSDMSKSVDATYAGIAASPAGLTNLQDGLRAGDVAAPKLQGGARFIQQVSEEGGGPWKGGPSNVAGELARVKGHTGPRETGMGALDALKAKPPRGPHRSRIFSEG